MSEVATPQAAKFNQAQYRRDWIRQHHSYEQQSYTTFKTALDAQTKSVSNFVKHYGTANLQSHLSVLIEPKLMFDAYNKVYQRVGTAHAAWTYQRIEQMAKRTQQKSSPVSFFSEQWRKLMSLFYHTQAADRISGVNDTTKQTIQTLLDDSQDMTLSEQATYITDELDDPDFNRMRALRIARTESTTAANYGAYLGANDADYEIAKIWLSILDMNTRPTHVDANGEQVAIDESFIVGGFEALYPGDLSLPPQECINCRCTTVYAPILDERGLPLLKLL